MDGSCISIGAFVVGATLTSACAGAADEPVVDDFADDAPRVVATYPSDGDVDVDPELVVLTAQFSEAMHRSGWSWVTETGREAPRVTGLPFYIDDVTNLLPVELESHTTYVVWVNSPDDEALRKFASSDGVPARAHRIRFTTR